MRYDVVQGYFSAVEVAGQLLGWPGVAQHWHEPSVLEHWSVAGLAGHLARTVFTVQSALSAPTDGLPTVGDAVDYYAAVPDEHLSPESDIAARIRERGLESAGAGAAELVSRYAAGADEVRRLLVTKEDTSLVSVFGHVLTLREWLRTRTLEIVVHSDDLSASVGCPDVVFPQPVFDDVIAILAAVASRRRGPHTLLRALARTERASGTASAF